MIVEYLVTFSDKDNFCRTLDAFHNLVRTIDGVSLSGATLQYKSVAFGYDVQGGDISADKHRFYHVRITAPSGVEISTLEELLKSVRSVLAKTSGRPVFTLWDGLGKHYAQEAYGRLHDLENTLRKLITKFMLTNVGQSWVQDNVPREVSESIRTKSKASAHDYLYEVDFIQLSNFLFKDYATTDVQSMIDMLRSAQSADQVNLEEMKSVVPRSNWDRYFSGLVNCESEYLRNRWEKLYDKRNQVAHNRPVSKTDLQEIITLAGEVLPKLQQAIESLDQVTVSDKDKETVSENVAASKDDTYLDFLTSWNKLNSQMLLTATAVAYADTEFREKLKTMQGNFRGVLNFLSKRHHILSREDRREILETQKVRNIVVHHPNFLVPAEVMAKGSAVSQIQAAKLRDALYNIERGELDLQPRMEPDQDHEDDV